MVGHDDEFTQFDLGTDGGGFEPLFADDPAQGVETDTVVNDVAEEVLAIVGDEGDVT